ncbi:MAG: CPBP family glutamic-type intramembrane protease [Spirochaetes bacterium]|nr:CPBP family glutamic-type intramembrane protease [Spirochaetota bacterium]
MNKKNLFFNIFLILTPLIFLTIIIFFFLIIFNFNFEKLWSFIFNLKNKENSIIKLLLLQFVLIFLVPFVFLIFKEKKIPFYSFIKLKTLISSIKFLFLSLVFAIFLQMIISIMFLNGLMSSESYQKNIFDFINYSKIYSFLFIVILAPISEEFYFRGLFSLFSKNFNQKNFYFFYFLSSSFFFTFLHFDFVRIPYLIIISLSFCYVFVETQNLWYTTIFHFLINFFQFIIIIFNNNYNDQLLNYNFENNFFDIKFYLIFILIIMFFIARSIIRIILKREIKNSLE